jgi:hypothetical protein
VFALKRVKTSTLLLSAVDAQVVRSGVARSVSPTVEITPRITPDQARVFVIRRARLLMQMRRLADVPMERFGRRISALLTVAMQLRGMGMLGSVFATIRTLFGRIRSVLVGRGGRWLARAVFDLGSEWPFDGDG